MAATPTIVASPDGDIMKSVTIQLAGASKCWTFDERGACVDPAVFWPFYRPDTATRDQIKEIVPWLSRNNVLTMKDTKAA